MPNGCSAKIAKGCLKGVRYHLMRSPIGTPQKHRRVLSGLGLRKIRQMVTRPNTSQVRGMIGKVGYLLESTATMNLHELGPAKGSRKRRKRIGPWSGFWSWENIGEGP